ncbi:hypothetical protein SAY86_008283 [Trapa natans]|uniref:Uncharacterized protein n=1 Tax=Trapa natans TaxID=22666 RepID=A0AAN7QEA3_TRANT|nr:hypothetical protein SAY86_008283 [Trapa natans]
MNRCRSPYVGITVLTVSVFLLLLIFPAVLSPFRPIPTQISDADEIDDLALLIRASDAGSSHLSTSSRKNKIAFLFLTNSDLHFALLWQKFFRNRRSLFNIYVHADPTVNITRSDGVFDGRFIPSKETARASPTLISAARRLLARALLDDPANAYFALLSQYCIPLHSFDYVYGSLFTNPKFDLTDASQSTSHGVRLSYRSYIEILDKSKNLWKRYKARGRYAMLPEVTFDQFRVGSQFFVLTRRHALTVVKDRRLWRKFRLPCYGEHCYPEEHYFPTLLSMEDPNGCTHYTLTRVNWTGSISGHPHTYGPAEVSPELIQELRLSNNSGSYLFARKFSPESLNLLMKIADKVIFRD